MMMRANMAKLDAANWLNFVVTNRLPRRLAGRWVGRLSRSTHPVVRAVSLWTWQRFTRLDLSDAAGAPFASMHACFTRRLKAGARSIDPDPAALTSPCDAIIGAHGSITRGRALQVKGMEYDLADLLGDPAHAQALEGGSFVTLRLTSAMYHRFHAPQDCRVVQVRHIFGDCWNVNPPTLRRVARLFCRNERVVLRAVLAPGGQDITLVAVAAILVSGIRLGFMDLDSDAAIGATRLCDVGFVKGEEMGWFEHGSTIVVVAQDPLVLADGLGEGAMVRVGQTLLRLPAV